ncbi:hypothetical protein KBB12_00005, partial [Candidatus Woesebacteria bacterium]|nr:hypothetical protein [Candidatus Woesebacteria bacterium]
QSQKTTEAIQSVINKLHIDLSKTPPFTPHAAQHLLASMESVLDVALLTHKDQTLTLATTGSGIIFLKREGAIVQLVENGSAAQGPPQRGDEYILTTNEFLELIGGVEGLNYYFLHYTSAEVVEMMKTYEDQTATCGFIAISYGTREAPSTTSLPVSTDIGVSEDSEPLPDSTEVVTTSTYPEDQETLVIDSITPDKTPKQRRVPDLIGMVLTTMTSIRSRFLSLRIRVPSRKKLPLILLILVPSVFLIYLAFSNIGGSARNTSVKVDYIESIKSQVEAKLSEADTEAFVNIAGVELTIDAARKILQDIPEKEHKKYADDIAKLTMLIDIKEKEVMRISDVAPSEYYDLALLSKEATASDVDFSNSSFYILDSAQGKIYIVDTTTRSHDVLSSDKYKGATQVTNTGTYTYVLTAKDGIFLAEEDRSTQVIKPDPAWGEITDMKAYTGNLYLLDAKRHDIFKYSGVDEQTFGDVGPYLVPELQGNLSTDQRFTIDGSIYVSNETSILKLTAGRKADFKLIVPHREVKISALYTDPDLEQLYVYDSMHTALYATNKEGTFDKQWIVDQPVISVAASEEGKSVFIVTAQHIYEIVQ